MTVRDDHDDLRGSGRNRSEIPELNRRLSDLENDLSPAGIFTSGDLNPLSLRAYLLTIEAYASALFQRLRAQLFESRLGMPKNDSDVFTILQQNGLLDLIQAKKLRQFCEARFLSTRDLAKIDYSGVYEMGSNLGWIRGILESLK